VSDGGAPRIRHLRVSSRRSRKTRKLADAGLSRAPSLAGFAGLLTSARLDPPAGMRSSWWVRTCVPTSAETPSERGSVTAVTGYVSIAGTGRVIVRHRAVALARHYREVEGRSITQIADRPGRSPATVKAYVYDPTGENARAVKAGYVGVCRDCGTEPRNGKGDAYPYCKAWPPGAIERHWTPERVLAAMIEWRSRYGGCPRPTTCRVPTRVDVGERRSHASPRASGLRRVSSHVCSAPGAPPARPPRSRLGR
jgi:hypothetical protein